MTAMIITGESSGELYGALLAGALIERWPGIRIMGVGGERMQRAGVELISTISGAFGITELFSAIRNLKATYKKTVGAMKKFMPDVLILIDYPDFNMKVAKVAKSLGIKILYYVSPQVWAWRKGRVKKIADLADRIAVILPFEKEIYRKAGVGCEFVGHPVLEEIESVLQSAFSEQRSASSVKLRTQNSKPRTTYKAALGLDASRPLLSLLPGSRDHELRGLLPIMIGVVREFKKEFPDYQFCIPLAPDTDEERYLFSLDALRQEGAVIKKGETIKVLAASDMAVVASGTATLQAAFLEVPMVVIYKLSPPTYLFGRLVVDVKYISLVNLLSGREVVPELLQQKANPEDIIKELKKIIFDVQYREEMLSYYRLIKEPFSGLNASKRVSEIAGEMAGWKS